MVRHFKTKCSICCKIFKVFLTILGLCIKELIYSAQSWFEKVALKKHGRGLRPLQPPALLPAAWEAQWVKIIFLLFTTAFKLYAVCHVYSYMSLSLIEIRLMIGTSHLFVFSNPIELEKLKNSGKEIMQVTYELAQEEIAQNSGYNLKQRSSSSSSMGKVEYFNHHIVRGHPFSTYAKFSENLTFLTPWYAHVRVRISGKVC